MPGLRRLGAGPGAGVAMSAGDAAWLAMAGPPGVRPRPGAPLWMLTELVRLRTAFPEFSFGICPGWRGLTFEAWREPGPGGLCAVITQDAGELWHELAATQSEG
jgi:hypothetical protein